MNFIELEVKVVVKKLNLDDRISIIVRCEVFIIFKIKSLILLIIFYVVF